MYSAQYTTKQSTQLFQQTFEKVKKFGVASLTRKELVDLFNEMLYFQLPKKRVQSLVNSKFLYRFIDESILTKANSNKFIDSLIKYKFITYFIENGKNSKTLEYAYNKGIFTKEQLFEFVLNEKIHELFKDQKDKRLQWEAVKKLQHSEAVFHSYNNSFLINFFIENYNECDSYRKLMQIFEKLDSLHSFIASDRLFFNYAFDAEASTLRKDPRYHVDEMLSQICSSLRKFKAFFREFHQQNHSLYVEVFRQYKFQYDSLCEKLTRQKQLEFLIYVLHRLETAHYKHKLMTEYQLSEQYDQILKYCMSKSLDTQILFEKSRNFEKYCKSEYLIQSSSKLLRRDKDKRDWRGQFMKNKFEYIVNI